MDELRIADPLIGKVAIGRKPLIRLEVLETMYAIIEPHAEPQIFLIPDARWNGGGHSRDRKVSKQHGIETFGDGEGDGGAGLTACGAGAIVTPVGRRSARIHQRELKLAAAVKVHRVDRDSALVVEDLRHLRLQGRRTDQQEDVGSGPGEGGDVHKACWIRSFNGLSGGCLPGME